MHAIFRDWLASFRIFFAGPNRDFDIKRQGWLGWTGLGLVLARSGQARRKVVAYDQSDRAAVFLPLQNDMFLVDSIQRQFVCIS